MRRLPRHPMLSGVAMLLTVLCSGCGGGGGGGGNTVNPRLNILSVTGTGATRIVTLGIVNPPNPVTVTYRVVTGPTSVIAQESTIGPAGTTATSTIAFPVAGTYALEVAITGDVARTTIPILPDGAFEISGSVEDGTTPRSGLDVDLRWTKLDLIDARVMSSPTTASGAFTFSNVVGDVDEFNVVVPGSP